MSVPSRQLHGSDLDALRPALALDEAELLRLLEHEIERAKRAERQLCVLVGSEAWAATPDNGADASFSMVEPLIGLLEGETRQIDAIGLLANGRIALVLPETNEHGAMVVGERILAALAKRFHDPVLADGLGMGVFPRHGRTPEELLEAADRALAAARTLCGAGSSLLEYVGGRQGLVLTTPPVRKSRSELSEGLAALLALAETVDVRDHLTAGHAQLVGRYAELIAREFSFSDSDIRLIRLAGTLHDVGKFGIQPEVFQKPGPLDEDEWEAVKQHPEIGARLLEDAHLWDIAEWVRDHHEQPNARGYPRSLNAGEVSLEARILGVADAYEAMTTKRVHRSALSHSAAVAELEKSAGTQFDRRVVQAFLRQLGRQCPVGV